ncbi:hypothetical protein GCM10010398_15810 [Streptomyces fimbriatus]
MRPLRELWRHFVSAKLLRVVRALHSAGFLVGPARQAGKRNGRARDRKDQRVPSDRLILLLLMVFLSAYAVSRHPSMREPLLVASAVGAFMLAVMLAK